MAWNPHTVAVTGASGMTGRHVTAALRENNLACVSIDRARWDVTRWLEDEELDRLFVNCDAIVHAAAAVPSPSAQVGLGALIDANIRSTLCLGDWARRRGVPLVFLSGAVVYAEPGKAEISETDPVTTRPISGAYGVSKLLAEQGLDCLVGQGLKLCVLRPSSVYGAAMPESRMVAGMLAKAYRGEDIALKAPTSERVNLVHASDVAQAVVAAIKGESWDVFNVAGPEAPTIAMIARACVAVSGRGTIVMPPDDYATHSVRYALDCRKAATALGYAPRVSLDKGLGMMLARRFV